LGLAWSFTAGLGPRSDLDYDPPPAWFVAFLRAVAAVVALAGLVLVVLGILGGGV